MLPYNCLQMAELPEYERSPVILDVHGKRTQWQSFTRRLGRNGAAVSIALMSAMFTAWQAYEAHSARIDARTAAKEAKQEAAKNGEKQADEVRQARNAAQESADAAKKLAAGMERSAKAAEMSATGTGDALGVSRQALQVGQRAYLSITLDRVTSMMIGTPVEPKGAYGVYMSASVTVRNTGNSPAYKISLEVPAHPNEKIKLEKAEVEMISAKSEAEGTLELFERWNIGVFRGFFVDCMDCTVPATGKMSDTDAFGVRQREPFVLHLTLTRLDLYSYQSALPDVMKMFPGTHQFLRPPTLPQ